MRIEFIPTPTSGTKADKKRAEQRCLETCVWAAKIIRVDGGFIAFESITDYETWKRQV